MRLVPFLRDGSEAKARATAMYGIAAGLMQGLLVVVLGMGLDRLQQTGGVSLREFALFMLLVLGFYYFFRQSTGLSAALAMEALGQQKLRIIRRLRGLGLREYETLDKGRVFALMTEHKDVVIEAARWLPITLCDMIMTLCACIYAVTISVTGFLLIVGVMAASFLFLFSMDKGASLFRKESAEAEGAFGAALRDFLHGFAELKMHQHKAESLTEGTLLARVLLLSQKRLGAELATIKAMSFFAFFIFIPCAALVFILPGFEEMPMDKLFKLFAASMFSIGPMMSFIRFFPLLAKAESGLATLERFEQELSEAMEEQEIQARPDLATFEELRVRDLVFQYERKNGAQSFGLHMKSFHLKRGELVILCGGNGSGKTTFMKLFAGLYQPQEGEITLDGQRIDDVGRMRYRSLFTIIFSNFHLFERLYGRDAPDPQRVNALLEEMRLASRVQFLGDRFSTLDLSSGQRKRLGLVCALLDDRPVLLMDEVAADFDPEFRIYFYRTLLPRLKAEGKTILAISHDDRFFDVADRVVAMREGSMMDAGEQA